MRHLCLWAALAAPVLGSCEYVCPSCDECDADTDTPDELEYLDYRYVRIDDLSDDERYGTPGAEIDAVELRGSSGSPKGYGVNVVDYVPVNEDINEHMDSMEAIGAPSLECYEDRGFVNLGGIGGYLILDFGTHIIEDNDTIIVYEVGGCEVEGGGVTAMDPIVVSVSAYNVPSDPWYRLGSCEGGMCTIPVGTLPLVVAED
jgi:hypothetical protein